MNILFLLLLAVVALGQGINLPVEDLEKEGAIEAIRARLNEQFSVYGGTISGGVSATTVTVNGILYFPDGTSMTTAAGGTTTGSVINRGCAVPTTTSILSATLGIGVANSTITATFTGGDVLVVYSGSMDDASSGVIASSFIFDGRWATGLGPTVSKVTVNSANFPHNMGFTHLVASVPAGSHSFALTAAANGGSTVVVPAGSVGGFTNLNQFCVLEVKP